MLINRPGYKQMNGIANLGQLYPEMLDIPDTDAVSRKLGELRGVPAALMRDEDELEEIRTMRKQKAEAVEQVAMAQAGGEAMRSMAEGTAAVQDNPELAAAAGGMRNG